MSIPRASLSNRRFTFPLAFVVLAALFFTGYFFYFLPRNGESLHQDGFLILDNIETSIRNRNEDLQQLFKSFYEGRPGDNKVTAEQVRELMRRNNVAGTAMRRNPRTDTAGRHASADPAFTAPDTGILLTRAEDGLLVYSSDFKGYDSIAIVVPADSFIQPILAPQRSEFFSSYLLVRHNDLLYKDAAAGIAPVLSSDTLLLNRKEAAFAGIKDVQFADAGYKMFYKPFRINRTEFILCGLIPKHQYDKKLHTIPASFIIEFTIAILLLLIFMPLLKFYFMGRNEPIRFRDLSLSALSLFGGMTLLTLIIIQVMLLAAAEIRTRENLNNLALQVDTAFTGELRRAYFQLDSLDRLVGREWAHREAPPSPGHEWNVSVPLQHYMADSPGKGSRYYSFDRASWIDSAGNQVVKGQLTDTIPLFTNIAARAYFEVYRQHRPYPLPGVPGSSFGFEPVNTWTNGEFSIILSKRSRVPHLFIASLSAKMFSVIHTILPPGYGYCITDETGRVLLHSDMNRNLQENILEKAGNNRELREAIVGRQYAYINGLHLYGRTNALHIRPIAKTPLFLITYSDKGYIIPVNMRILTFSVLFSLLTYLICLLIWLLAFRKGYYSYPHLYPPLTFLKWIIPKRKYYRYYTHSIVFLLVYSVILLGSIALSSQFNVGNFVLVLALITPVNIISGLYIISYQANKEKYQAAAEKKWRSVRIRNAIALHVLANLVAFFVPRAMGYHVEYYFLFTQGFLDLLFWVYYLYPSRTPDWLPLLRRNYFTRYATYATLVIIALAVLPGTLYTFYAHNQELIQSVKKGQLYLAESLEQRRSQMHHFAREREGLKVPADYYERLQYRTGIYRLNHDTVCWDTAAFATHKSYEQFYFTIANNIGSQYYDPLLFPALKDSADNREWQWSYDGRIVDFKYDMGADDALAGAPSGPRRVMLIESVRPERYMIIGLEFRGLLLFSFIGLMIFWLYYLISSLAERLFLIRYRLALAHPAQRRSVTDWYRQYVRLKLDADGTLGPEVARLPEEFGRFLPATKLREIAAQELDLNAAIGRFRKFYAYIWDNLSDREKHLLLDLAKDGMANFRNEPELYHLIDEGILVLHREEIRLFSLSFRAYILQQENTGEVRELRRKFREPSSWHSFRILVPVLLIVLAAFIFFTQEEVFQQLLALVGGLTSLLALLPRLFSVLPGKPEAKKE